MSTADRPSRTTPSTGTFAAGLDDDAVADLQLVREDAHFLAVAQHPAALREDLDELADGLLRAGEGERFQALADAGR